jgi:hypothetical protein
MVRQGNRSKVDTGTSIFSVNTSASQNFEKKDSKLYQMETHLLFKIFVQFLKSILYIYVRSEDVIQKLLEGLN